MIVLWTVPQNAERSIFRFWPLKTHLMKLYAIRKNMNKGLLWENAVFVV